MSEKALLEELVKQFKKQNEILEKISSAIECMDIPDYRTQLVEIQNSLGNMENAVSNIGLMLQRSR